MFVTKLGLVDISKSFWGLLHILKFEVVFISLRLTSYLRMSWYLLIVMCKVSGQLYLGHFGSFHLSRSVICQYNIQKSELDIIGVTENKSHRNFSWCGELARFASKSALLLIIINIIITTTISNINVHPPLETYLPFPWCKNVCPNL